MNGGEFEVGHLQQLDRLQKLRRQDHRLTLTQHQFGRERHTYPQPFATPRLKSCFRPPRPATSRVPALLQSRAGFRAKRRTDVAGDRPGARLDC